MNPQVIPWPEPSEYEGEDTEILPSLIADDIVDGSMNCIISKLDFEDPSKKMIPSCFSNLW